MIRNFESGLALVKHVKSQCYGDNTRLPEKLRNFAGEKFDKIFKRLSGTLNTSQLIEIAKEYSEFCKTYYETTELNDIGLIEKEKKWFLCCVEFDIQENTKKIHQALQKQMTSLLLQASTVDQLHEGVKNYAKICTLCLETSQLSRELTYGYQTKSFSNYIKADSEKHTQAMFIKISEMFRKEIANITKKIVPTSTSTQLLETAKMYQKICDAYPKIYDTIKQLIPEGEHDRFLKSINIDLKQFNAKIFSQISKSFGDNLATLTRVNLKQESAPNILIATTKTQFLREKLKLIEAINVFKFDTKKYHNIKNKIENNLSVYLLN